MSARLYGRAIGNGSLRVVTSGFREALTEAGLLSGFVATDMSVASEEEDGPPGALAQHAVYTGQLNQVSVMQQGAHHEQHWVQVTPNSTYIPREILQRILQLPKPRILSASEWGTNIIASHLEAMGYERTLAEHWASTTADNPRAVYALLMTSPSGTVVPVLTVRHGVSGFRPQLEKIAQTRSDYESGKFRVLHFSTSDGQRKGTLELIEAWRMSMDGAPGRELLLVLDHHAKNALLGRLVDRGIVLPPSVRLLPRGDLDSLAMSRLLCHAHAVAAPSRGEGFGLLPLQARACGVPVLATLVTGHSAGHCVGSGVVVIPCHPSVLAPIDDGPNAEAPAVSPESIATSLVGLHNGWMDMSVRACIEADEVAKNWTWSRQLQPLTRSLAGTDKS